MLGVQVLTCAKHGEQLYWLEPKTMRYRCPSKGCESYVDAEVVERSRAPEA